VSNGIIYRIAKLFKIEKKILIQASDALANPTAAAVICNCSWPRYTLKGAQCWSNACKVVPLRTHLSWSCSRGAEMGIDTGILLNWNIFTFNLQFVNWLCQSSTCAEYDSVIITFDAIFELNTRLIKEIYVWRKINWLRKLIGHSIDVVTQSNLQFYSCSFCICLELKSAHTFLHHFASSIVISRAENDPPTTKTCWSLKGAPSL